MSDTCTTSEYGSRFDVMGSGGHRHSLAYNKGRAGVIGKPNVITVRQGGTYAIQPLSRAVACGTQAIRIQRGTANEYYYVDYRTRTGVDMGYSATSSAVNGVRHHHRPATTNARTATPDARHDAGHDDVRRRGRCWSGRPSRDPRRPGHHHA